jgi:hypothetical protein
MQSALLVLRLVLAAVFLVAELVVAVALVPVATEWGAGVAALALLVAFTAALATERVLVREPQRKGEA